MNHATLHVGQGISPVSPLLFGSFLEHIENCIDGGVYEAGSPLSGPDGLRRDVMELCREMGPTLLRFPGGTVMGIYQWEDHIGPREARSRKRNLIWGGMLQEGFGTAEFVEYCRQVGAEPMLTVNMPTGSPSSAGGWVEYCNGTGDSYYANLRRAHGYPEPFGVKYWCIGNESYAEPDLGAQHDPAVYIREAWEFVKYMKLTDPGIKLVLVGHDEGWNRQVLDSLEQVCDYLSVHFYANTSGGPEHPFRMLGEFEERLRGIEALLEEYNAAPGVWNKWYRFPPREGPIRIALDEWNIWNENGGTHSPYGLDQTYTWNDALWTACFLNLLLRHPAVAIANQAQLVNVIAPIIANREGSWRQTTFYPMKHYRHGAGSSLLAYRCDHPHLDIAVTGGERTTAFVVNRGGTAVRLEAPVREGMILTAPDLTSANGPGRDWVEERPVGRGEVLLPADSIGILQLDRK